MGQNNKVDETVEVVEELNTPDGAKVEVVKKKGFFKKIGDGIKSFEEKHPKVAKAGSTVLKVGAGVAVGVGLSALGRKKSNENPEIDMIDLDAEDVETFDADIADEISNDEQ